MKEQLSTLMKAKEELQKAEERCVGAPPHHLLAGQVHHSACI